MGVSISSGKRTIISHSLVSSLDNVQQWEIVVCKDKLDKSMSYEE